MARTKLDLNELAENGRPGLTKAEAAHLAEAAAISAEAGGSPLPHVMSLSGRKRRRPSVSGPDVTEQMRRTYRDLQEAVEWGAEGVAAVIIEVVENLTIYERSPKSGFGFDYFLISRDDAEGAELDNFFGNATHVMEVSGTLQDDDREMQNRVDEKVRRLNSRQQFLPAYVVVVDFRRTRAKVVKHG